MEILVRKYKRKTKIKKSKIERLLKKYQIVIIGKKSELSKKPMSNVIIRDENIVFAFHYLFKGIKKYYTSAGVRGKNGNWEFQVPMSAEKIAEMFKNTIEYRYKQ